MIPVCTFQWKAVFLSAWDLSGLAVFLFALDLSGQLMLVCHTFRWTSDSYRSYNSADSRFLYVLNFGWQPIPWTADLWMSYNSVDSRFLFVLHFGVQLDCCLLTSKMKAVFLHALSLNALQRHSTEINALQRHNTENSKHIFAEKELRGHSPNFHIHVSVSDLYIPTIGLPIFLQENMWTDPRNI